MRSKHYFAVLLIELGDEFLTMGQEGEGVSGGDVSEVSALGGTQGVTAAEREGRKRKWRAQCVGLEVCTSD